MECVSDDRLASHRLFLTRSRGIPGVAKHSSLCGLSCSPICGHSETLASAAEVLPEAWSSHNNCEDDLAAFLESKLEKAFLDCPTVPAVLGLWQSCSDGAIDRSLPVEFNSKTIPEKPCPSSPLELFDGDISTDTANESGSTSSAAGASQAPSKSDPASPGGGVKWLDREIRAKGRAAVVSDDKPPPKSDMMLRSYSNVRTRRAPRPWWKVGLLALRGTCSVGTGVVITMASVGILATAMAVPTALVATLVSYNSVKLLVAGLSDMKIVVNEDAMRFERGTSSVVWSTGLLFFVACTSVSAYTGYVSSLCRAYGSLLKHCSGWIASGRVKMAVTKVMASSVNNFNSSLERTAFGKQIQNAIFSTWDFLDSSCGLSNGVSEEVVTYVKACFMQPARYMFCVSLMALPPALLVLGHGHVEKAFVSLFHLKSSAHEYLYSVLEKRGHGNNAHWMAAAIQALAIIGIAKPFGHLGETLYGSATLFIPNEVMGMPFNVKIKAYVAE